MNAMTHTLMIAKKRVTDHVYKETPYTASWDKTEAPIGRYTRDGYRKYFSGYEGDTWIYKLTFWGTAPTE
jgi:hypothetical protein